MKKRVFVFGVLCLLWAFTGPVSASFIGDSVTVGTTAPTYESDYGKYEGVTVENGDGDLISLGRFTVDIDEYSMAVDFTRSNTYWTYNFNGLVIREIDDYLTDVNVKTDVEGWDDSRIIFGEDFAAFNWSGLSFTSETEFNAMFEFGPNPIPIPTTAVLFVTGLIGFAVVRRKKSNS